MADDISKRLDALEAEAHSVDGIEQLTIRVCYEQTFFDADGQRCQKSVPAEYDYSTPFPPPHWNPVKGCLTTMRVLYPIGDPENPSSAND